MLTWYVGNRSPSITETITVNGVAFDLTSSTVKFKMRAPKSSTLKVDAAATIVTPLAGAVRYDWVAADVDTAGDWIAWWEVTTAGKVQDVGETLIQILAHAGLTNTYVELGEFKLTTNLNGLDEYDTDLKRALTTASRAIDELCDRRFYLDVDAAQVRYYTPTDSDVLYVDDIAVITSLKTDDSGDGTFENTWTLNTDYVREPLNAAAGGRPFTKLCVHPSGSFTFPGYPRSVELTGQFGWPAVPSAVKDATMMLAHRIVKRERESPAGILGIGLDGAVVRMMSQDPDVAALLAPYSRAVLVA